LPVRHVGLAVSFFGAVGAKIVVSDARLLLAFPAQTLVEGGAHFGLDGFGGGFIVPPGLPVSGGGLPLPMSLMDSFLSGRRARGGRGVRGESRR
jgi:hypothetical protein